MGAVWPALIGLICFLCAYLFYSRYLSEKIFGLLEEKMDVPAVSQRDDVDFMPSKSSIVVGHHFSSIAGAAPIVGPAIAAIWGWLPAFIWIVLGVIFIGACHDFGALVLSMRHRGQSIAALSHEVLGPRVRFLFLTVVFFVVWMVIAVFALVIANLFVSYPAAVLPVNFEIVIAILMGILINRKGFSLTWPSILAQVTLYVMIYLGSVYPLSLFGIFGENQVMAWMILLLVYSFIASVLPVWVLLQPRDYINSHQLFVGLGLMVVGLAVSNPPLVAPATNFDPVGAPPWMPFLFITIACGAVSGFHGLVASGTTSKQVASWRDCRVVGYGSMLGEGLLALLATLAVCTGFMNRAAWHSHYATWGKANGLSAKIEAFVSGAGQFINGLGIPLEFAQTVIVVLIISFAATSLDTACRIQRTIISEFGEGLGLKFLKNRYFASALAVGSAFLLMLTSEGGTGGLLIWPLFGASNQILAALTLMIVFLYLQNRGRTSLAYLFPSALVLTITFWGLILNIQSFYRMDNYLLMGLAVALLLCNVWIFLEGLVSLFKRAKA